MSTITRIHDDGRREVVWRDGEILLPESVDAALADVLGRRVAITPTGPYVRAHLFEPLEAYALIITALPGRYETDGDGFDLLEPDPDLSEDVVF